MAQVDDACHCLVVEDATCGSCRLLLHELERSERRQLEAEADLALYVRTFDSCWAILEADKKSAPPPPSQRQTDDVEVHPYSLLPSPVQFS